MMVRNYGEVLDECKKEVCNILKNEFERLEVVTNDVIVTNVTFMSFGNECDMNHMLEILKSDIYGTYERLVYDNFNYKKVIKELKKLRRKYKNDDRGGV